MQGASWSEIEASEGFGTAIRGGHSADHDTVLYIIRETTESRRQIHYIRPVRPAMHSSMRTIHRLNLFGAVVAQSTIDERL